MNDDTTKIDRHVGARLRLRRKELGISQSDLGTATGISFQQVQKYEQGKNRISISTLLVFAHKLECPVDYFLQGLPQPGEAGGRAADLRQWAASEDASALFDATRGLTPPEVQFCVSMALGLRAMRRAVTDFSGRVRQMQEERAPVAQ